MTTLKGVKQSARAKYEKRETTPAEGEQGAAPDLEIPRADEAAPGAKPGEKPAAPPAQAGPPKERGSYTDKLREAKRRAKDKFGKDNQ